MGNQSSLSLSRLPFFNSSMLRQMSDLFLARLRFSLNPLALLSRNTLLRYRLTSTLAFRQRYVHALWCIATAFASILFRLTAVQHLLFIIFPSSLSSPFEACSSSSSSPFPPFFLFFFGGLERYLGPTGCGDPYVGV